jgi:RimJ/RimL family protein N-acetyltransferase
MSADKSLPNVILREPTPADVGVFFEQQKDDEANFMVAFTMKDPADKEVFWARWDRILGNGDIHKRTIIYNGEIAGNITSFEMFGELSIGYWLGKAFWGKGIATQAVALFLGEYSVRPLFARVAKDNIGSRRVLQKNGFVVVGEDKGFANARGAEIEEYILKLEKG